MYSIYNIKFLISVEMSVMDDILCDYAVEDAYVPRMSRQERRGVLENYFSDIKSFFNIVPPAPVPCSRTSGRMLSCRICCR